MEEGKSLAIPLSNEMVKIGSNEMLFNIQLFEHSQRIAKLFASSTMVPDHFKNNIGNCFIALNIASRMDLDPFMVMQKMYVIKGKPGIESQLIIALVNRSGLFSPLQYKYEGEGDNRQCTAFATHLETGELCSQTVTWTMVESEGWNKKPGSKWNTLPELMFRYRSAAFFARVYCPEVILGMRTTEEIHDTINAFPQQDGTYSTEKYGEINDKLKKLVHDDDKNKTDPEKKKEKQPETEPEDTTNDNQKTETTELDFNPWEWDRFKNLKFAGFKSYCEEHAAAFDAQDDDTKDKILKKWEAIYPQSEFIFNWPVFNESSENEADEDAGQEGGKIKMVNCPNGKGQVETGLCDTLCDYRQGCPAFD